MHASDALLDYLQALIAATRSGQWFVEGLSPRAGIAVLRAAKARALMAQRDYVAPDDVQAILPQTIAHRLHAGRRRRPRRASSRCARWSRPRRCPRREPPAPWPSSTRRRRSARLGAAPGPALRRRFRAWWQARLPRTDTWTLTQRNIYILPTAAGWAFALTLLVMLLASINYQLNLGYVLTFLLAGSGAGVDAPDARHAARADAAPAPGRSRCSPASRRCSRS